MREAVGRVELEVQRRGFGRQVQRIDDCGRCSTIESFGQAAGTGERKAVRSRSTPQAFESAEGNRSRGNARERSCIRTINDPVRIAIGTGKDVGLVFVAITAEDLQDLDVGKLHRTAVYCDLICSKLEEISHTAAGDLKSVITTESVDHQRAGHRGGGVIVDLDAPGMDGSIAGV